MTYVQGSSVRNIMQAAMRLDDSCSNEELGSIFTQNDSRTAIGRVSTKIALKYNTAACRMITNGTTSANHIAVMALAAPGAKTILSRDVHLSVAVGAMLARTKVNWIYPFYDEDLGVLLPVRPLDVELALRSNPDVRLVAVNGVTYDGLAPSTPAIAALCDGHAAVLMMDEAHGSHFRGLHALGFPQPSITLGAKIVTQSPHKTMNALSQASLILLADTELCGPIDRFMNLLCSTSSSVLLMQSLEFAMADHDRHGYSEWSTAVDSAQSAAERLRSVDGVRVLERRDVVPHAAEAIDPSRLTINVRGLGITGFEAAGLLYKDGIVVEKATFDCILVLFPPRERRISDRLVAALENMARYRKKRLAPMPYVQPSNDVAMSMHEAFFCANRETVRLSHAVGRISAEMLSAYPPGQLIVAPGEVFSPDLVALLSSVVAKGGILKGFNKGSIANIAVVK
jgi:arginine decarboxylase